MSAQSIPVQSQVVPFAGSERWLSSQEVLSITGWTDRWLRKKVAGGAVVSRTLDRVSGNGQPQREYLASTLPDWAQAKLCPPSSPTAIEAAPVNQLALFSAAPIAELPRVALSEAETAQALERWEILRPIAQFNAALAQGLKLSDGRPVTSEARMILLVSEQKKISARTLKTWKSRYLKGGVPALADRERSDKGKSRWFEGYPDAKAVAAYIFLEKQDTPRAAYFAICDNRERLGIPEDDLPSYETVRAWLRSGREISPAMQMLARDGRRKYLENCAPYISRGYTDVYANEIWVSDHMIHDVEVANDLFIDAPYGAPIRLRLTALADYRSRFIVGATWAWEGSSRSITTTLRHAVLQYGPCEVFYCDNGKDYLKAGRGACPAHLRRSPREMQDWWENEVRGLDEVGVIARLGMMVQHCKPYHGQSKHVERWFRTLHANFDKKWTEFYTGGKPELRPDATTVRMIEHRKLLKAGTPERSEHPLASEFIARCSAWIAHYNRAHKHDGRGMDGATPLEVFTQYRNPNQRPAPDSQTLALMLAERTKPLDVRECAVTFNKRRYIAADEVSSAVLHEHNRRQVVLAYDPLDPVEVALLDLDGHLLGWAKPEQYLRQSADAETKAAIAASMAERARLEKATRESLMAINHRAQQLGTRDGLDNIRALPVAVNDLVTQRRPRFTPDDTAVAPKTAVQIAAGILEGLKKR